MSKRRSPYADCERCGAPLIWARTIRGKKMPLDRAEDPQGFVAAMQDTRLVWHARVVVPGEILAAPWKRYAIHDSGCADTSGTPQAPPGVTQLDTWRKAASEHAAAQRRTRGKRTAAQPYRGYRRTP